MGSIVVQERLSSLRVLKLPHIRCGDARLSLAQNALAPFAFSLLTPPLRVRPRRRSGEVEGSWAVVAALAEKSPTKEASSGKKFGIWCACRAVAFASSAAQRRGLRGRARRTLTDLDGTSMKLFLFGEAFAEHWKVRKRCGEKGSMRSRALS